MCREIFLMQFFKIHFVIFVEYQGLYSVLVACHIILYTHLLISHVSQVEYFDKQGQIASH